MPDWLWRMRNIAWTSVAAAVMGFMAMLVAATGGSLEMTIATAAHALVLAKLAERQ